MAKEFKKELAPEEAPVEMLEKAPEEATPVKQERTLAQDLAEALNQNEGKKKNFQFIGSSGDEAMYTIVKNKDGEYAMRDNRSKDGKIVKVQLRSFEEQKKLDDQVEYFEE